MLLDPLEEELPFRPDRLNAGPALFLNGPKGAKQLPWRRASGLYDKQPLAVWAPGLPVVPPSFKQDQYLEPGAYTVDNGSGGEGVGPFRAAFNIPAEPLHRPRPRRRLLQLCCGQGQECDVPLVSCPV